jgi:hypothetical protein
MGTFREGRYTGKGIRRHSQSIKEPGWRGFSRAGVFYFYTVARTSLARLPSWGQTQAMRALAGLLLTAALIFGVYQYYLKRLPVTDEGTAPTQAISLTGVRSDLLQIAQAERAYVATNGNCVSLEELISSNSLAIKRNERDGYSYAVSCAGPNFRVVAQHAPAPAGSPIRYPNLAIDQNMQVDEVP